MTTPASSNRFKGVGFQPVATPSTPAAGDGRLFLDTADGLLKWIDDTGTVTEVALGTIAAGAVATDAIWDAKGDLAAGTGANTADKLTAGANDTVLMADSAESTGLKWVASQTPSTQAFGDAAAEGTADTYARGDHKHAMPASPASSYAKPAPTNIASQFSSSSTSCAVTTAAFTTGDKLVAVVAAGSRGCNSITQTNVTWTQRYTASGNSQFVEVWTGVVSGTAGTTATFAFTGSGTQQCLVFQLNEASSAFTAAASLATDTSAGSSTHLFSANTHTAGRYAVCAIAATAASHTAFHINEVWYPLLASGGRLACGLMRANSASSVFQGIKASSTAHFAAIVELS